MSRRGGAKFKKRRVSAICESQVYEQISTAKSAVCDFTVKASKIEKRSDNAYGAGYFQCKGKSQAFCVTIYFDHQRVLANVRKGAGTCGPSRFNAKAVYEKASGGTGIPLKIGDSVTVPKPDGSTIILTLADFTETRSVFSAEKKAKGKVTEIVHAFGANSILQYGKENLLLRESTGENILLTGGPVKLLFYGDDVSLDPQEGRTPAATLSFMVFSVKDQRPTESLVSVCGKDHPVANDPKKLDFLLVYEHGKLGDQDKRTHANAEAQRIVNFPPFNKYKNALRFQLAESQVSLVSSLACKAMLKLLTSDEAKKLEAKNDNAKECMALVKTWTKGCNADQVVMLTDRVKNDKTAAIAFPGLKLTVAPSDVSKSTLLHEIGHAVAWLGDETFDSSRADLEILKSYPAPNIALMNMEKPDAFRCPWCKTIDKNNRCYKMYVKLGETLKKNGFFSAKTSEKSAILIKAYTDIIRNGGSCDSSSALIGYGWDGFGVNCKTGTQCIGGASYKVVNAFRPNWDSIMGVRDRDWEAFSAVQAESLEKVLASYAAGKASK